MLSFSSIDPRQCASRKRSSRVTAICQSFAHRPSRDLGPQYHITWSQMLKPLERFSQINEKCHREGSRAMDTLLHDGFVLVSHDDCSDMPERGLSQAAPKHLEDINEVVDAIGQKFWPVNQRIHDHPEVAFKEFIAHDALTSFVRSYPGWEVTPSAYGMKTSWVAVFDSGRPGPVVSFNAEMGRSFPSRAT